MNNKERRTINGTLEVRSEGEKESRTIFGYALKFNERSENFPGDWQEVIKPGALDSIMKNGDDVRALFNHDPNLILARTTNNTLRLYVDEIGLKYEFEAPETTVGNDLLVSIKRGDINQSSFAFSVKKEGQEIRNENGKTVRYITNISRLFDVSPVTYPAYTSTDVTVRSIEDFKENKEVKKQIEVENEVRERELNLLKQSL